MAKTATKVYAELAGFDVLSEVLGTLGLRSRVYCRTQLAGPWAIEVRGSELLHFHLVEHGEAWLSIAGRAEPEPLRPGEVLVIRSPAGHRLADQPGKRPVAPIVFAAEDDTGRMQRLRHGSNAAEPDSVIVCGAFALQHAADHPLMRLLPPVMRLRPDPADWLGAVAGLLSREARTLQPGSEIVISRLTDLLFIQVLRAWMREHAPRQGWLAALSHPQIGPVLAAVHEQPERAWTVEALAALAHLSRSAFSARFAKVVGEPAQTYLMRLRMQAAARLVSERRASLAEIAAATGYESEAAFNKAFKRWHGLAPGQFRELLGEAA